MAATLNTDSDHPSVNRLTAPLVKQLLADAAALRVGVEQGPGGSVLVDAGIDQPGGLEAGRRIAELCLGGLGQVRVSAASGFARWPWQVEVTTSHPVVACLGSQYAGWSLSSNEPKYHALGSGPARALALREPLFEQLGYRDRAPSTCLILETDRRPPPAVVEKIQPTARGRR